MGGHCGKLTDSSSYVRSNYELSENAGAMADLALYAGVCSPAVAPSWRPWHSTECVIGRRAIIEGSLKESRECQSAGRCDMLHVCMHYDVYLSCHTMDDCRLGLPICWPPWNIPSPNPTNMDSEHTRNSGVVRKKNPNLGPTACLGWITRPKASDIHTHYSMQHHAASILNTE